MPQVFSSNDNYERFLPTLARRFGQKFNPFRLKVRIHVGINAKDPIDRGTTPDYNDCFFNCTGQKPNYVEIFASAGDLGDVKLQMFHRIFEPPHAHFLSDFEDFEALSWKIFCLVATPALTSHVQSLLPYVMYICTEKCMHDRIY